MIDFSAVGYFFGKRLQEKMDVPIGLIDCSWGGSPIEAWMPEQIFQLDPQLNTAANMLPDVPWAPSEPGVIFNGMIAPIIPFKISGVIWYQGESNTANAFYYEELLESMIINWRKSWQKHFTFYFVQIAPFKYGRSFEGAIVRDEMRKVLDMKKTGMVVVSDIGNVEDIHPRNKHDVGKRLANLALSENYDCDMGEVHGPLFDHFEVNGNEVVVHFRYANDGLVVKGKELIGFQLAGEDQRYYEAKAHVKGNTVLLSTDKVDKPVAVRFAFTNTSESNLFNKEGLPASTFRTDDWHIELKPQK
jgi:sialate O-acetylesterase